MKLSNLCAAISLAFLGCARDPAAGNAAVAPESSGQTPTNRIAAPALVRRNLGIQFAAAERRRVAATIRLPGRFELLPQGRQEYRTPIAGRVTVKVMPMQRVALGDVLYEIDSPEWLAAQRRLNDLATEQTITKAKLDAMTPLLAAHEAHERSLHEARSVLQARIDQLASAQRELGGQAEGLAAARLQFALNSAQLAEAEEKHATLTATLSELRAEVTALEQRDSLELSAAAAIAEMSPKQLAAIENGAPAWRNMRTVAVRARGAGIAARLPAANGAWANASELLAEVVDVTQMRFVAHGLQSDLASLREGLAAKIVPVGSSTATPITGSLQIGIEADPSQRTVSLYVPFLATDASSWARPDLAAFAEIETMATGASELAIPSKAVLQDGLTKVYFLRAKNNPDEVIRCEADIGIDDGRWVEVKSGLMDGDEVVVDGAYELVLASSGMQQKGGHFHADGTFHDEKDH